MHIQVHTNVGGASLALLPPVEVVAKAHCAHHSGGVGTVGAVGSELKYVGEKLRFGKPIESSIGLHKLLGIADEETLGALLAGGETAMAEELQKFGSDKANADEYGWTDADWLRYLRDERAAEHKPPRLLEEYQAISSVAPARWARPSRLVLRTTTAESVMPV